MEGLLTNNIFFVYLLGILVIINYEAFEKKQKLAIIYACSYGLMFNEDLRCALVIFLLLFILFLYEEYLNKDLVKIQYVTNIRDKVLDFVYMYTFQYKLLYVLGAIILKSNLFYDISIDIINNDIIKASLENVLFAISIFIMVIGVHKMFNDSVELKSFTQINQKFSDYPYYQLPLKDCYKRGMLFEKLELVADIEDYTFFMRKKSYCSFSIEFVQSVIKSKREKSVKSRTNKKNWINCICRRISSFFTFRNIIRFIRLEHKLKIVRLFIGKVYRAIFLFIKKKLIRVKRKVKSYIRGYSTIEMQLIRILAYKKGLKMGRPKNWHDVYLIATRKIYEIIYAPIFFRGHKKYLNIPKDRDYYRHYLVYIYLHTVQTNLNGKTFAPLDKVFADVDIIDWPKEALFIITLGLNNLKITKDRVNIYMKVILKYHLNLELIYQLVDCIQ